MTYNNVITRLILTILRGYAITKVNNQGTARVELGLIGDGFHICINACYKCVRGE